MAGSEQQNLQDKADARSLGGELSGTHFAQALDDEEDFRIGYRVETTVEAIGALSRRSPATEDAKTFCGSLPLSPFTLALTFTFLTRCEMLRIIRRW